MKFYVPFIELLGFYGTVSNAFQRLMARNDEIKKNREITACGFPSIYSKYFFQTNTKIFYKSLKSFITCFWPEITYWRFMTCSIPQCQYFLSKITYWRFIICSISQCMNSWSIICELAESTRYLLIQKSKYMNTEW